MADPIEGLAELRKVMDWITSQASVSSQQDNLSATVTATLFGKCFPASFRRTSATDAPPLGLRAKLTGRQNALPLYDMLEPAGSL